MKDFGNAIYAFGCVVAATVLGIGVADYWFGHHELITFLSWAVLAVIPWLVGFASSYILARVARPIAPATRREGLRPIIAKLPELLGRKD